MGTVARVTEISATSEQSFEDAIATGIKRASETLREVRSAWVKEQQVKVDDSQISEYQVNPYAKHTNDASPSGRPPNLARHDRVGSRRA